MALPQVCLPVLRLVPVSVIAPKLRAYFYHQICSSKKDLSPPAALFRQGRVVDSELLLYLV